MSVLASRVDCVVIRRESESLRSMAARRRRQRRRTAAVISRLWLQAGDETEILVGTIGRNTETDRPDP